MLIRSAKQVARWSSCLLAFAIGCAPSAKSQEIGSISTANVKASSKSSTKNFSSQPGFLFRSVFVSPQYAGQAETPLPLSWWEQGSDSPVAVAIGAAEGTRQPDGSRTAAYYWHTDPGNAADNFGSFSFQHFRPHEKAPVQRQGSTDDKRWVSARRALPEIADRRQMQRLRRFHDQLLAQAQAHQLELTPLELLNGLDLANQSELAALDSWGYIDRLVQAKQMYHDPDEQILQARTWSYWHPTLHRWDAPGLGNTQTLITRDQRRRADAVKLVFDQTEQRSDLLAQLQEATPSRQRRSQAKAQQRSGWSLTALRRQRQRNEELGAGFVEQPMPLPLDATTPLQELVQETRSASISPEQRADIALAEALAFDEAQADDIARSIVAVESEVALLLNEPASVASSIEEESVAVAETSLASSSDELEQTVPALAPGWESGLLMASTQLAVPSSEVAESEIASRAGTDGLSPALVVRQPSTNTDVIVVNTSEQRELESSTGEEEATVAAPNNIAASQDVEAIAAAPTGPQEISVQLPPQPEQETLAEVGTSTASVQQLGASSTLAIASPQTEQTQIEATTANRAASEADVPTESVSANGTEAGANAGAADSAVGETTANTTAVVPATTPGSVSVVAVAERSAQALANQTGRDTEAVDPAPEPAPPLSAQAEALASPATEAAVAAAEEMFTQHIELGEQQAAEASARAAAAREAAQKLGVTSSSPYAPYGEDDLSQRPSQPAQSSERSLLNEVLQPAALSRMMTTPKLEADQVADAIIFFDGLTD